MWVIGKVVILDLCLTCATFNDVPHKRQKKCNSIPKKPSHSNLDNLQSNGNISRLSGKFQTMRKTVTCAHCQLLHFWGTSRQARKLSGKLKKITIQNITLSILWYISTVCSDIFFFSFFGAFASSVLTMGCQLS